MIVFMSPLSNREERLICLKLARELETNPLNWQHKNNTAAKDLAITTTYLQTIDQSAMQSVKVYSAAETRLNSPRGSQIDRQTVKQIHKSVASFLSVRFCIRQ